MAAAIAADALTRRALVRRIQQAPSALALLLFEGWVWCVKNTGGWIYRRAIRVETGGGNRAAASRAALLKFCGGKDENR